MAFLIYRLYPVVVGHVCGPSRWEAGAFTASVVYTVELFSQFHHQRQTFNTKAVLRFAAGKPGGGEVCRVYSLDLRKSKVGQRSVENPICSAPAAGSPVTQTVAVTPSWRLLSYLRPLLPSARGRPGFAV